jgi:sulfite exporter TauE/SafE
LIFDAALVASLGLMGLSSVPHCALMCAAPCAAAAGQGGAPTLVFHIGRLLGYAAAGAAAAASVGWLREAAQASALLKPVWTLLQAALFALGMWLLVTARWPGWLGRSGVQPRAGVVRLHRAAGSGLLWFAWPCGALQGALLIAALAATPAGGAAAMGAFALASSPGLWLAPWALRRLGAQPLSAGVSVRLTGGLMLVGATWALAHGLWLRVVALCT